MSLSTLSTQLLVVVIISLFYSIYLTNHIDPIYLFASLICLFIIHTFNFLSFTYQLATKAPLGGIPPAHPLAPWTSLWIAYVRWQGRENATLKHAHEALGPVVRLAPEELSVNSVRGGIREVYAGGFEKGGDGGKGNWYNFFANYGGVHNMFSLPDNRAHSARKRMLSNVYSKSTILASAALRAQTSAILYSRFLPQLSAAADAKGKDGGGVLNIYALLSGCTMDIVTGYIFGLKSSSQLTNNPKQLAWFLDLYNSRRSFNFWPQEFPRLTALVERLGYRLVPRWVDAANKNIEDWTLGMCEGASSVLAQGIDEIADSPVVFEQLSAALVREARKAGCDDDDDKVNDNCKLEAASEVLDHLAAGFDTSGITLNYVVHELSRNPQVQQRLQQELRTLSPPLVASSSPGLPDARALDGLPFLHAVIWETLRLHSAIPGPQPRVTPARGCHLGPEEKNYFVPGGIRVSASAGLLHANEDVYVEAGAWKPERWLELEKLDTEKRKDMESRWFWAFGSGGRMCVGSHLAVYQMKYIIAALYSNYTTSIVDDTGIAQSDAYTAPPLNDSLLIRLQRLDA